MNDAAQSSCPGVAVHKHNTLKENKHERSCSRRGRIQDLMMFIVCSVYGGMGGGGVVVCIDPFNIDLWCPAYLGSELGVCASAPEQTLI